MSTPANSHPVRSCRCFTLIELLVAIAILGLALATTLMFIAQSQNEFMRARDEWLARHALTQATEYALLVNPRDLHLPDDLLPEGYRAECQIVPTAERLPEFAAEPRQGWILAAYQVTVYDPDGEVAGEQTVYKLLREDSF